MVDTKEKKGFIAEKKVKIEDFCVLLHFYIQMGLPKKREKLNNYHFTYFSEP